MKQRYPTQEEQSPYTAGAVQAAINAAAGFIGNKPGNKNRPTVNKYASTGDRNKQTLFL